jgi:hypothetical protein
MLPNNYCTINNGVPEGATASNEECSNLVSTTYVNEEINKMIEQNNKIYENNQKEENKKNQVDYLSILAINRN